MQRQNDLFTFASNYWLAHLTQSARISESEFIPQTDSSYKTQYPCTAPPSAPLPQLHLGTKPIIAPPNVDAVTGKCCLWRKCPMMTTFTAGWLLSLIHHSHTLRRFAYFLPAAYQQQPFSLSCAPLSIFPPLSCLFPPSVLLQQIPPAKCFTLEI